MVKTLAMSLRTFELSEIRSKSFPCTLVSRIMQLNSRIVTTECENSAFVCLVLFPIAKQIIRWSLETSSSRVAVVLVCIPLIHILTTPLGNVSDSLLYICRWYSPVISTMLATPDGPLHKQHDSKAGRAMTGVFVGCDVFMWDILGFSGACYLLSGFIRRIQKNMLFVFQEMIRRTWALTKTFAELYPDWKKNLYNVTAPNSSMLNNPCIVAFPTLIFV